jgi:hypothetical protein
MNDIGSLAGGMLEILYQKECRARSRSISVDKTFDDNSFDRSQSRSASFDESELFTPDKSFGSAFGGTVIGVSRDTAWLYQSKANNRPPLPGARPPMQRSRSNPDLLDSNAQTPRFLSRSSSRVTLDEMSDAGSLVQAIMDDIGKVKSDVEAAEALLAVVSSYDEIRDVLSIHDTNPFEDDSINSNFTNEGRSVSSRLSFQSASKRSSLKGSASYAMPKKNGPGEGPGLPKPSARPPAFLQIPKPPKRGIENKDVVEDVDDDDELDPFSDDEENNHELRTSTSITTDQATNPSPVLLRSQSDGPSYSNQKVVLTATELIPVLLRSQSHNPATLSSVFLASCTEALAPKPQGKQFVTTSDVKRLLGVTDAANSTQNMSDVKHILGVTDAAISTQDMLKIQSQDLFSKQDAVLAAAELLTNQSNGHGTLRTVESVSYPSTLVDIHQDHPVLKNTGLKMLPDKLEILQQVPQTDTMILPHSKPVRVTTKKVEAPKQITSPHDCAMNPEHAVHNRLFPPIIEEPDNGILSANVNTKLGSPRIQPIGSKAERHVLMYEKQLDDLSHPSSTRSPRNIESRPRLANEKNPKEKHRRSLEDDSLRNSRSMRQQIDKSLPARMSCDGVDDSLRELKNRDRKRYSEPLKTSPGDHEESEERRPSEATFRDAKPRSDEKIRDKKRYPDEKVRDKNGRSDKFDVRSMVLPHEMGRRPNDEKARETTKYAEEKVREQNRRNDILNLQKGMMLPHELGRHRCEEKAREGKRRLEERVHDEKPRMDTLKVQDMTLSHEMRRESRRLDQQRDRKDPERSRQTNADGLIHDPPESIRYFLTAAEKEASRLSRTGLTSKEDRREREKVRAEEGRTSSGKMQSDPATKNGKIRIPAVIRFDQTKRGRSVSPYTEKDDREIDLNEMVAKLGEFGHVSARDNLNRSSLRRPSSDQRFVRPERLSKSDRGASRIGTSRLVLPEQFGR